MVFSSVFIEKMQILGRKALPQKCVGGPPCKTFAGLGRGLDMWELNAFCAIKFSLIFFIKKKNRNEVRINGLFGKSHAKVFCIGWAVLNRKFWNRKWLRDEYF